VLVDIRSLLTTKPTSLSLSASCDLPTASSLEPPLIASAARRTRTAVPSESSGTPLPEDLRAAQLRLFVLRSRPRRTSRWRCGSVTPSFVLHPRWADQSAVRPADRQPGRVTTAGCGSRRRPRRRGRPRWAQWVGSGRPRPHQRLANNLPATPCSVEYLEACLITSIRLSARRNLAHQGHSGSTIHCRPAH
jgi:hypothetical protein